MSTKIHVVGAGDGRHAPDDAARLLHGITDRYGVELVTGTGAS
ncbi:hypothetical protein [Rhodococcus pseudokoreensis]|nr:hypothetical protein [Rhodococcus pseudokoreensis]